MLSIEKHVSLYIPLHPFPSSQEQAPTQGHLHKVAHCLSTAASRSGNCPEKIEKWLELVFWRARARLVEAWQRAGPSIIVCFEIPETFPHIHCEAFGSPGARFIFKEKPGGLFGDHSLFPRVFRVFASAFCTLSSLWQQNS